MIRLVAAISKAVMPRLIPLIALDQRLAARAKKTGALPPVFIIGAPRSGTTILYQALASRYRFVFPTNVESALFAAPWLMHHLSWRWKRGDYEYGERSFYGYVPGLWAPSEAGPLFHLLLDASHRRSHFRDLVHAISAHSGRPFLCKNTHNSLRITALAEMFPDALFIWCRRDRDAVARSIVRMREMQEGDTRVWSGVRPDGWEAVASRNPYEQALWQIDTIEAQIDCAAKASGCTLLTVNHADFVADRDRILLLIASTYRDKGFPLIACER